MKAKICDFCHKTPTEKKLVVKIVEGKDASQMTIGDICDACKDALMPKILELTELPKEKGKK